MGAEFGEFDADGGDTNGKAAEEVLPHKTRNRDCLDIADNDGGGDAPPQDDDDDDDPLVDPTVAEVAPDDGEQNEVEGDDKDDAAGC